MKNKKGFTLIEVLAIIVIIAIIGVITVPIILNLIEDSRRGSVKDSTYGYIDSVNGVYFTNSLSNPDTDTEDGVYSVSELKNLGVRVEGEEPSEGWCELVDNEVVAYSLKFGEYVVTKYSDSDIFIEKNGVIGLIPIEKSISEYVDSYVKDAVEFYSDLENGITGEVIKMVSEMTTDGLTKPSGLSDNGWIHFKYDETNGLIVVNYSLKFNIYVANYSSFSSGKYLSIIEIGNEALAGFLKEDGAMYLRDVMEVYYNPDPTTGTKGIKCEQSSSLSTTGTSTGCMHWYLYSVKGDYANMLLDHNITEALAENGVWASKSDYEAGLTLDSNNSPTSIQEGTGSKAILAGISYPGVTYFPKYNLSSTSPGVTSRGPVTALNTLKDLTTNWKTGLPKVPNSSSTNEYIVPSSANGDAYQIDYTGYHARLITFGELLNLGCWYNATKMCPTWMEKGTYREDSQVYENISGYWSSSNDGTYNAYNYYSASNGRVYGSSTPRDIIFGVRPVITVPIEDIL